MRKAIWFLTSLASVSLLMTGCSGPEKKLGRGVNNSGEILRMGEMRRSMEQSAIYEGPTASYSTGLVKGLHKTMARTALGFYEIATFPFPTYEPVCRHYLAPLPDFPDSYKPNMLADPIFTPDANLGFGGGDVMPFIPGSRFRIFEY